MYVRSLCRHFNADSQFREENEEFELSGPLYEHVVEVEEEEEEPEEKTAPTSRQQKAQKHK